MAIVRLNARSIVGYAWRARLTPRANGIARVVRGAIEAPLSEILIERRRALCEGEGADAFAEALFVDGAPIDALWAERIDRTRTDHDCDCTCAHEPGHARFASRGMGWVSPERLVGAVLRAADAGEVRVRTLKPA